MKAIRNFVLIVLAILIVSNMYCQEITRQDEVLITSVDSSGTTFYQVATVTEFDNGALDSTVTARQDSATFLVQQFTRAHNAKLPIRESIKTLAMRGEFNNVFTGSDNLIQTVTGGENYFDLADQRGYYNNLPGIWRMFVDVETSVQSQGDTIEFNAWFEVNQNGIGIEIEGANDPTPVPDGWRIRLSPYQPDFVRLRVVQPIQSRNVDVAYLFEIIDDQNPNSSRAKRQFWANEIRTGDGGVRLIKFPDVTN